VMAAWLAFLKSRLLLPPEPGEFGPSGEELAAHLAFQLERLEAMRDAAARLMARDQKGRDFFARGVPEDVLRIRTVRYTATLIDLMQAYARIRTRDEFRPWAFDRTNVFTMEQALERLRGLIGYAGDWAAIETFLPEGWHSDPVRRRSATAATFAATLELAKEGRLELRQAESFAPIQVRRKEPNDRPRPESLFAAPPLAEQERMVEAILFASPSRSPWRSSRRGCPTARTRPRRCTTCAGATRGGGSSLCGWATAGRCAPRPTSAS
jgi:chromatin segregation and condensation protein Rec8/ScpA/Scc1 (kleisin family)